MQETRVAKEFFSNSQETMPVRLPACRPLTPSSPPALQLPRRATQTPSAFTLAQPRKGLASYAFLMAMVVRPLQPADRARVVEVYADAVRTLAAPLYQPEQIHAWALHPLQNKSFEEALVRGHGLVATASGHPTSVEGFALLDPPDRLALLYCRGRSSRQGLGTLLVQTLENHARSEGHSRLRTEASRLSRPLLERLGWTVDGEEHILFAGQPFVRWRMSTTLR